MNKTLTVHRDISSLGLHLLAMALMLCDHLWATVIPGHQWLTWLGRIAFPIFAFLIAEGYHHTRDVKKYTRRILIFALLSEIPFNLMYVSSWIYPFHQNVLWTFLIALLCLRGITRLRQKHCPLTAGILAVGLTLCCMLLATITMTDYGGSGVLTVVLLYLLRGNKWWQRLGQFAALVLINWGMISGLVVPVELFGLSFEIPQQGMAILAVLPLCCYRGRQGPHSKPIQYVCYAFYPVHALILWGINTLL